MIRYVQGLDTRARRRRGGTGAGGPRCERALRHGAAKLRPRGRRERPEFHAALGAPTPGDAADGVVVAAPAQHAGISSELEALATLHRKGALTDGEFAAAKAKLLG